MIQLYYDIDTARRVNENNAPLTTLLQFYYNTAPQVQFRFLSGGSPVDLSAIKAWRAAIDTEFNASTVPVCRIENADIDASKAETGIVTVTFNCNSSEFLAKLNNNRNVNAWLDIYGINSNGQNEFIAQMPVILLAVVDPEQGDPAEVPPLYPSADAVRAMIAGTDAYELARNAEFHIGDRAYYPGEPGYLLICIAEGTSADTLPELDKTVNTFLDGTVTWQVYDLSESGGGGAANITVNGVSPDTEGNIELTARCVPMPEKTEGGDNIIVSSVCGSQDLAQFYERMQSAVFTIDGNTVSTQEDSDGYYYTGEVDLKYYVESPEYSWIVLNIEQHYGEGNVDPEKHYYLHTQIHEMLDKFSACAVNESYAGEYKPGQIWLDAGRIPYAYDSNPDTWSDGAYYETIYERIDAMCYGTFTYPNYWSATSDDAETGAAYTTDVTYTAPSNGWLIIEWCSEALMDNSYVEIDSKQFQLGTIDETGGKAWRQFIFPIAAWSNWLISRDECRSYTIHFLPCTQLFNME